MGKVDQESDSGAGVSEGQERLGLGLHGLTALSDVLVAGVDLALLGREARHVVLQGSGLEVWGVRG